MLVRYKLERLFAVGGRAHNRAGIAYDLVIGWIPGMKFRWRVSYQAHTGMRQEPTRRLRTTPSRTADTGSCPRLPLDGSR